MLLRRVQTLPYNWRVGAELQNASDLSNTSTCASNSYRSRFLSLPQTLPPMRTGLGLDNAVPYEENCAEKMSLNYLPFTVIDAMCEAPVSCDSREDDGICSEGRLTSSSQTYGPPTIQVDVFYEGEAISHIHHPSVTKTFVPLSALTDYDFDAVDGGKSYFL